MRRTPSQAGQATVELVAVLPALVAITLAAWWIVAAAATWVQAGGAARAGARAAGVGEDPVALVHATAPSARVGTIGDTTAPTAVRVTLRTPPLPGVGRMPVAVGVPVVRP